MPTDPSWARVGPVMVNRKKDRSNLELLDANSVSSSMQTLAATVASGLHPALRIHASFEPGRPVNFEGAASTTMGNSHNRFIAGALPRRANGA
jgi:hypothetical protein